MTDAHVRALLGGAELAPLVDRVTHRVRHGRPLTGTVVLSGLGIEHQAALANLLGRPVASGSATSVRLEEVDRIVRESGAAADLASAVTVLRGTIPVRVEEAARERARWDAVFAPLDALADRRPELAGLPALFRRTGVLKATGDGPTASAALIVDLVAVLDALPTSGETLPAFAARVLHRAHALDIGTLRALADGALMVWFGDADHDEDARREEQAVANWTRAGIAFDTLASSVLVHGLRFSTREPIGVAIDALAAAGQPVLVTLRMLFAGAHPIADEVWICENPAVLIAAADRHGARCAPLVCVRGQPSAAARRLLGLLADSGATLRYHGDFDWGGVRIANRIVERYGALPWRYSAADLAAADVPGDALAGDRVEASWDPDLAGAIEARGMRLEEEQVLATLLPDLAR